MDKYDSKSKTQNALRIIILASEIKKHVPKKFRSVEINMCARALLKQIDQLYLCKANGDNCDKYLN